MVSWLDAGHTHIMVSFAFHVQAIPAAFLLDPAHAIDIGSSNIIPPWGSLHDEDRAAVKNLLRRMAPRGKQNAVVEELVQFIGAGYADKDFARAAMVSCFPRSDSYITLQELCPAWHPMLQLIFLLTCRARAQTKEGSPSGRLWS